MFRRLRVKHLGIFFNDLKTANFSNYGGTTNSAKIPFENLWSNRKMLKVISGQNDKANNP